MCRLRSRRHRLFAARRLNWRRSPSSWGVKALFPVVGMVPGLRSAADCSATASSVTCSNPTGVRTSSGGPVPDFGGGAADPRPPPSPTRPSRRSTRWRPADGDSRWSPTKAAFVGDQLTQENGTGRGRGCGHRTTAPGRPTTPGRRDRPQRPAELRRAHGPPHGTDDHPSPRCSDTLATDDDRPGESTGGWNHLEKRLVDNFTSAESRREHAGRMERDGGQRTEAEILALN